MAGCAASAPTLQIVAVTPTPARASPLAAGPSADAFASAPTPLPTLPRTPYPPAETGGTWRTIVPKVTSGDYVSVDGLKPPAGVYILDWLVPTGCDGFLDNGLDVWGWGDRQLEGSRVGLTLADLTRDDPYDAFTRQECSPWVLALKPVGTWFGPNSDQVARLLVRLQTISVNWAELDQRVASQEALALESRALDAAKRDPNLGAAVQHAFATDWFRGNTQVERFPNAAHLSRLAILAEVAQDILTADDFDTLYGPIADYIDSLSLGLPATP